jgi:hypothetical protein
MLLQRRPAVLSKREILDTLWPDCFVAEGSVATLISEIRAALGAEGATAIRTVHGVGYAFAADATELASTPTPAPSQPGTPRPVLIDPGPPARLLELRPGANVVGRGLECDVRLASPTVSRAHARIVVDGDGGAAIEDLGSHNGTWIGDRPVTGKTALASGDRLRLGTAPLVFRVEPGAEGETESASRTAGAR